jgi:hypothetical protein
MMTTDGRGSRLDVIGVGARQENAMTDQIETAWRRFAAVMGMLLMLAVAARWVGVLRGFSPAALGAGEVAPAPRPTRQG